MECGSREIEIFSSVLPFLGKSLSDDPLFDLETIFERAFMRIWRDKMKVFRVDQEERFFKYTLNFCRIYPLDLLKASLTMKQ